MVAKDERTPIELFDPAAPEAPGPTVNARFDEATLRLARLIGRQIAREQFERRHCNGNRAQARTLMLELLSDPYAIAGDSQYLVNSRTNWAASWKEKRYKKGGRDIRDADLWRALNDALGRRSSVNWDWVRGHNRPSGNERGPACRQRKACSPLSRLVEIGKKERSGSPSARLDVLGDQQ
jgi:ribonuclease HI